MAARALLALQYDRETPATLRSAVEALDEIVLTAPAKHLASLQDLRADLMQELNTLEGQGSLF